MNSELSPSPDKDVHQAHDGAAEWDPTHMFRRGHVWVGNLSPYAAGAAYQRNCENREFPPRQIRRLERQLQNLYLPSFVRGFIRGQLDTLSSSVTTSVVAEAEHPKPTQTENRMKLKETNAVIDALGALVVALVALAFAFCKAIKGTSSDSADAGEEEEEEAAPKPAKKQAKKQAKTPPAEEEEEEEESDNSLLDDGEEEEEEESSVTIADLKAIGQKLLKAGKADKLKAILKKNGAENLGGLDESKYASVHEALKKVLG